MKYAVLESGGKQYLAREGETIEVDRLALDVGKTVNFKDVLLLVDDGTTRVGTPYLDKAAVKGTIVAQVKAPKVIVYKYVPKQRYRRKQGHRQRYTRILIDDITTPSPKKAKEKAEKKASSTGKSSKKRATKASTKKKASSSSKKKKSSSKKKESTGSKSKKSSTKRSTSTKKSS